MRPFYLRMVRSDGHPFPGQYVGYVPKSVVEVRGLWCWLNLRLPVYRVVPWSNEPLICSCLISSMIRYQVQAKISSLFFFWIKRTRVLHSHRRMERYILLDMCILKFTWGLPIDEVKIGLSSSKVAHVSVI